MYVALLVHSKVSKSAFWTNTHKLHYCNLVTKKLSLIMQVYTLPIELYSDQTVKKDIN